LDYYTRKENPDGEGREREKEIKKFGIAGVC